MARHSDDLTDEQLRQLDFLLSRFCNLKPKHWSFVKGLREIIGRPDERGIGKFSIRFGTITSTEITIGFFLRQANVWKEWAQFPPSAFEEMLEWMVKVVGQFREPSSG